MTSNSDDGSGAIAADPYAVDRHFGDIGPVYADARPNAASAKARGAADRMWKKVADDLERIDEAQSEEDDDE
jgi:hypothetical protein